MKISGNTIFIAGIMQPENLLDPRFLATAENTVTTNLLGQLRLIAAFLPERRSDDYRGRRRRREENRSTRALPAMLDAGGDPALIAGWIRETTAVRSAAATTARLTTAPPARMTEDEISSIVDNLGGWLDVLRRADPRDKAELHIHIGLRTTYKSGSETLKAEVADLGRVLNVCPEGDLGTNPGHS